mmetsp:Transcript_67291/g.156218  ORF Transcript_67291/g.156218 Transcript_67291/m.156218 type:complete len:202 (+) Transcript_67291:250-855(+)
MPSFSKISSKSKSSAGLALAHAAWLSCPSETSFSVGGRVASSTSELGQGKSGERSAPTSLWLCPPCHSALCSCARTRRKLQSTFGQEVEARHSTSASPHAKLAKSVMSLWRQRQKAALASCTLRKPSGKSIKQRCSTSRILVHVLCSSSTSAQKSSSSTSRGDATVQSRAKCFCCWSSAFSTRPTGLTTKPLQSPKNCTRS